MRGRVPLVMIPGTLCTEQVFAAQVRALDGVAQPFVRLPTEGRDLGACAVKVLASVPERFALLGFSLGGLVALEVMRRAPGRVLKLCLTATNPQGSTPQNFETWARWRREVEGGTFAEIVRTHAEYAETEEVRAVVTEMAFEVGTETFVRQLELLESRPDSRPSLGAIGCPTLLIVGRRDRVTPPEMHEEMCDLIPGARLETLASCGHYALLEKPHEVSDLLRGWLEA